MTFEELQQATKDLKTQNIQGKDYTEVNQRVKAFRKLFPEGTIETEIISLQNGVVVMKASVKNVEGKLLATGTAYEKEGSTFINKTSYIENCETSAVGRALAMLGIGIDLSIASAEEVTNAVNNQKPKETPKPKTPMSVKSLDRCKELGIKLPSLAQYLKKGVSDLSEEDLLNAIKMKEERMKDAR